MGQITEAIIGVMFTDLVKAVPVMQEHPYAWPFLLLPSDLSPVERAIENKLSELTVRR